jgi:hypothetical protein
VHNVEVGITRQALVDRRYLAPGHSPELFIVVSFVGTIEASPDGAIGTFDLLCKGIEVLQL